MTSNAESTPRRIELSTGLTSFSADDPGGWQRLFEHARLVDEAGFDRVVIPDHVVYGERLEEYARPEVGGTAGGRQPTGPDGHWLEPIVTLSVLAGMTSRVRLATGILLAALRRPVVLAKEAATLDVLSGGRLDLGVGVGWQREEYDAAGLDFADRGRLLDHTLEVCQELWSSMRAEYHSPELSFSAIHQMPKPLQPGGVPLWISGTVNRRVASRLTRFGLRWIPWGADSAAPSEGIARMRDLLHSIGTDPSGLQVMAYMRAARRGDGSLDIAQTMEQVPALVEAGATDLRLTTTLGADRDDTLEQFTAIVAAFGEASAAPSA